MTPDRLAEDHGRLLARDGLRLQELLGAGSHGRVYRAVSATHGEVAVKVLTDLDAITRRRFEREARLTLRLRHPALVAAHEVTSEEEVSYLVMDLVRAPSLAGWLGRQRASEAAAALLLERVGAALAHAHAHDVVHRDVKPSNILLPAEGPVLCDLGVARDLASATRCTGAGTMVGTLAFVAPECLVGQEPTGRADVFSLAGTCYQALTGQAPFHADDPLDSLTKIAQDRPVDVRRARPELSRALADLLDDMFEKDPAARCSADEVATRAAALRARSRT